MVTDKHNSAIGKNKGLTYTATINPNIILLHKRNHTKKSVYYVAALTPIENANKEWRAISSCSGAGVGGQGRAGGVGAAYGCAPYAGPGDGSTGVDICKIHHLIKIRASRIRPT